MTVKKWFLVNPDNDSFDEEYFEECLAETSTKLEIKVEWTGQTRDSGFGQEKKYILTGEHVEAFIDQMEERCHM
jgi:hypothetical protein